MARVLRRIVLSLVLAASAAWARDGATSETRSVFPPWQNGANNDALHRGISFTVAGIDSLADFHGDLTDPKLVLYVGGNYFFAMAPLVKAFEQEHADLAGKVFWETLPPGVLVNQMDSGGVITTGNMTFTIKPDAYFAGLKKVQELIRLGKLEAPAVPYVTNTLAIMIPKANPAHVESLANLGRPGVRLAMPNPEFEGVARQIKLALRKAGGEGLETAVYDTKVKDGSTVLTQIHHRQTPLFLMQGSADAGVTWKSEAIFQVQVGNPISMIEIPSESNATGVYAGALTSGAAHPEAAKIWLAFLTSPTAIDIFERYGFKAWDPAAKQSIDDH